MINIILCDDNIKDLKNIETIVQRFMDKNKIDYNIHLFNDYNKDFYNICESKLSFKIYLLDIETPSKSGIDVARDIRKRDLDSIIIFLTAHEELGNIILKNDLLFLSFINKFDDCENRLITCLGKAMKLINKKQVLRFEDGSIIYSIKLDDILYLTKDSVERKTVIKTDYAEFKVNVSLSDLSDMLDDRFTKTHRSCIINKNRTSKIDKQNKEITFDTGEVIDLVSDKYKRELV